MGIEAGLKKIIKKTTTIRKVTGNVIVFLLSFGSLFITVPVQAMETGNTGAGSGSVPVVLRVEEDEEDEEENEADPARFIAFTDNSNNIYGNVSWNINNSYLMNKVAETVDFDVVRANGLFYTVLIAKSENEAITRTNLLARTKDNKFEMSYPFSLTVKSWNKSATGQISNIRTKETLPEKVKITFPAPMYNKNTQEFSYAMLYENGNEIDEIPVSYSERTGQLTFETKLFCKYEFFCTIKDKEMSSSMSAASSSSSSPSSSSSSSSSSPSSPSGSSSSGSSSSSTSLGSSPSSSSSSSNNSVNNNSGSQSGSTNTGIGYVWYTVIYRNLYAVASKQIRAGELVPNPYVCYPNLTFYGWYYKDTSGNWKLWNFQTPLTKNLELQAFWLNESGKVIISLDGTSPYTTDTTAANANAGNNTQTSSSKTTQTAVSPSSSSTKTTQTVKTTAQNTGSSSKTVKEENNDEEDEEKNEEKNEEKPVVSLNDLPDSMPDLSSSKSIITMTEKEKEEYARREAELKAMYATTRNKPLYTRLPDKSDVTKVKEVKDDPEMSSEMEQMNEQAEKDEKNKENAENKENKEKKEDKEDKEDKENEVNTSKGIEYFIAYLIVVVLTVALIIVMKKRKQKKEDELELMKEAKKKKTEEKIDDPTFYT